MTATVLNIKIDEVERKIPEVSGLVTTSILNTKIREVENKIHGVSDPESLTKYSFLAQFLSPHKCNGIRLLSPESECTSCVTSC